MKNLIKILITSAIGFTIFCPIAISKTNYKAVDEFTKEKYSVSSEKYFYNSNLPKVNIEFDNKSLLKVITNTKSYFDKFSREDSVIRRDGVLENIGVNVKDVCDTLDFMINILKEDIKENKDTRLKDPDFINKNFKIIRWKPYNPQNPKQKEEIRLTKYAIFKHAGSKVKTEKYNIPLYELTERADNNLFYKKYTKQDVLSGIYEKGGKESGNAKPLVYLTREGLEEALMEGTLLVNFPDKTSALYNVDRNNGISYVKGLNPREQKRYWYFKKVNSINGYGNKIENRIHVEPGVTFAGDVFNLGLGKIIVLEYKIGNKKKLKLGVVADTGGAFLPNLHQLDFLAGIYKDRKEFVTFNQNMPTYAKAYILVKK